MVSEERLDVSLRSLGPDGAGAPGMSAELEDMLSEVERVSTRCPRREAIMIAAISVLYAGSMVFLYRLRGDIDGLPMGYVAGFGASWLIGFVALLWLALVPRAGEVMPRWRNATVATAVAGILFPVAGLVIVRSSEHSIHSHGSVDEFVHFADMCMRFGLMTSAVPIILATLVLRRAVPVRSRSVAAALGAGGGALGGFALHMHCSVTDKLHVGFVHGGLVLVCALVAAVALPRFLRPR